MDVNSIAQIQVKNTPILMDLASCDRGISPTHWQKQQFPTEFHPKLKVLHDGIDTTYFYSNPRAKIVLPAIGLDLSQIDEIITYATPGMEPYRGFPQFMEAVALIQQRRPNCHVVVMGTDRVAYGKALPGGKTYKQFMLEKLPLDLSRLHFTGSLPSDQYRQVLQASSAHIYLTHPFALSWSMLEAMACGCLLIASDTAPVTEVIQDGKNGLLVDFFSPNDIADRVDEVLGHSDRLATLRTNARETILKRYDLAALLPQHIRWLLEESQAANKSFPQAKGLQRNLDSPKLLSIGNILR